MKEERMKGEKKGDGKRMKVGGRKGEWEDEERREEEGG